MEITGAILAAGLSSRMGDTNKLLLEYNNHTVIEEVVWQMLESDLKDIMVITGFESEKVKSILSFVNDDRLRFVYNKHYQDGRTESVRCAVRNMNPKSKAICFMVGDKPQVKSTLINKAINAYLKNEPDILYVNTPDGRGHPIIFSKAVCNKFLKTTGVNIGNDIIEKYKDKSIIIEDDSPQFDIDTGNDYNRLLKLHE